MRKQSKWVQWIKWIKPFIQALIVLFLLLFIQFLFYSSESIPAYVFGGFLLCLIGQYGKAQNDKLKKEVSRKKQLYAFLLGCIIIGCGILLRAIWIGESPIIHAYQFVPIPRIIYACIIAPIGEEIIFRQMLYREWLTNRWIGRILSSTLFIAIHAPFDPPTFFFYVIATIGLLVAYEKSGDNVLVSIGVHATNNIFAFL